MRSFFLDPTGCFLVPDHFVANSGEEFVAGNRNSLPGEGEAHPQILESLATRPRTKNVILGFSMIEHSSRSGGLSARDFKIRPSWDLGTGISLRRGLSSHGMLAVSLSFAHTPRSFDLRYSKIFLEMTQCILKGRWGSQNKIVYNENRCPFKH